MRKQIAWKSANRRGLESRSESGLISSRAVSPAGDETQAGQPGALQMAGESGRLGLLQGTRAAGEQAAREGIIKGTQPHVQPAPREGEARREAARLPARAPRRAGPAHC